MARVKIFCEGPNEGKLIIGKDDFSGITKAVRFHLYPGRLPEISVDLVPSSLVIESTVDFFTHLMGVKYHLIEVKGES